jgi:phospholipid-translocating ATPase
MPPTLLEFSPQDAVRCTFTGIRGLEYTRTKFWMHMMDGLYQSAVIYFFPYLIWSLGLPISFNGKGVTLLADFGTTVAVAAMISANTYG